MLNGISILVVEDELVLALDLVRAIEDVGGHPVGPVSTISEAMTMLGGVDFDAAIVDANLLDRDVTPLAVALIESSIPFVVHTAAGLPVDLSRTHPGIPVVLKPARSEVVVALLLQQIPLERASALVDSE
jgi:CheY-like chemotaxis protein